MKNYNKVKNKVITMLLCFLMVFFSSCNYVTYSLRSRNDKVREKPSTVIFDRIVDFRIENNSWPVSREDFISKGRKYKEVFDGFPYAVVKFDIKDSTSMFFYFDQHIKDLDNYKKTHKVDLNSYGGYVKFYKENDKFLWKLKM